MTTNFVRWYSHVRYGVPVGIVTAFFGTIAITVSLFDETGARQQKVARAWGRWVLRVAGCPIVVTGQENLQGGQPAVYAANHLSFLDTPALFANLPFQFRILARHDLFGYPFIGWYLRRSGQVPVVIGDMHASVKSLSAAARTVKHGMPVVIFPEGGRTPDGTLQPLLSGMAFIAIRAQVPIVPMALVGTYEAMPMHTYHVRPRPLHLAIGKPIPTAGLHMKQIEEVNARVFAEISRMYAELSPAEA